MLLLKRKELTNQEAAPLLLFIHRYATTPIMASGVKARYKMPAFNPFAGFSPNWAAVLVQIEHCANTGTDAESTISSIKTNNTFFMWYFLQK